MLVDDLVAGRVIFGHGEFERGSVFERENGLDGAFAKGFFAEHHGAVQVLQAAGDNFRRAGAAQIGQHDNRDVLQFVAMAVGVIFFQRMPAFGGDDQLLGGQKFLADFHGLIQQSAGIPAQIQDQSFHVPCV